MNNKRGQALSTNTIIIVILAVLVLIVVAVFFTGGFTTFVDKIKNIWSNTAQEVNEIVLECNSACSNYENTGLDAYKNTFCQKEYDLDVDGDKEVDQVVTCPDLSQVSCSSIEAAGGCF
jgi:predicted PurR-regulated permease PerM